MALWTSVIIYEENQAKWLFRPKELKLLGQKMIDFLMCPPYRVSFLTGYDKAEEKLLNKAREIQFSLDLRTVQDDHLIALFDEYSNMYYGWYKYGWFCEPVQFQSHDILTSFLEKETKKTQPKLDMSEASQAIFTIEENTFSVGILEHLGECAEALSKALRNDELVREFKGIKSHSEFPSRAARVAFAVAERSEDESLKLLIDKLKEHSPKC